MITLKQVLVPTDFSTPSEVAVNYARELTKAFDAKLHILHVMDSSVYPVGEWYVPPPTLYDDMEKDARERLQNLLSDQDRDRFKAELVTRRGSPFVEIVRYAKSRNIDLIVMGTHGRGPIAHMLMGSVAEKVVRKSPCPVLTVRHPEHEFVMP
jgi:nucleotide-binding universal stress UspA family protein